MVTGLSAFGDFREQDAVEEDGRHTFREQFSNLVKMSGGGAAGGRPASVLRGGDHGLLWGRGMLRRYAVELVLFRGRISISRRLTELACSAASRELGQASQYIR